MNTVIALFIVLSVVQVAVGDIQIAPSNPAIDYIGRWDLTSSPDQTRADWSGTSIRAAFTKTTSIVAMFNDGFNYQNGLNIVLTNAAGAEVSKVFFNMTALNWKSPTLSASETYTLTVTKRTEAVIGTFLFKGFTLNDGAMIMKASAPSRHIEVIGDSITCGFGNSGLAPCGFTAQTEDETKAYGWLIAEELKAEAHIIAWNGKGLMRNWDDPGITGDYTMTRYWGYTLATVDTSDTWKFNTWAPDAVVINLGTNDFVTQPNPPQDVFVNGYVSFIKRVTTSYASAPRVPKFFLLCGPMINDPCCAYVKQAAAAAGATYIDMQNILVDPTDNGCAGHPSINGHAKMAAIAIPIIKKEMNW